MNHLRDRVPHMADGLCQYAHQYNNKVLICKVSQERHSELLLCETFLCFSTLSDYSLKLSHVLSLKCFLYYPLCLQRCYEGGREVIVVPKTSASSDNPWFGLAKFAWSG